MMNKIHDVVETNLMASEDVASLIDVTRNAVTDLDNGRLVVRTEEGYEYPTDETAETLYLVTTPEVTYQAGEEFFNKEGRKVRVVKVMLEDEFSTTAFDGDLNAGDAVMVNAEGQLVANVAGVVEFEVLSKRVLGGRMGVTVKRVK